MPLDKIMFAFAVWAVIFGVTNPFFEGPKRRIAMIGCAIGATLCWIVS